MRKGLFRAFRNVAPCPSPPPQRVALEACDLVELVSAAERAMRTTVSLLELLAAGGSLTQHDAARLLAPAHVQLAALHGLRGAVDELKTGVDGR